MGRLLFSIFFGHGVNWHGRQGYMYIIYMPVLYGQTNIPTTPSNNIVGRTNSIYTMRRTKLSNSRHVNFLFSWTFSSLHCSLTHFGWDSVS